ncbi:hypothetical protein Gorai_014933 [Gossypium raimondii]|uniref:Uncharacterized protein n=1 Tax=Gossypium raimondii TaxID=29730 RepID=A0A7J8P4C5_GOSRA|nr:hypothetical protein [Gossypium raimondii]
MQNRIVMGIRTFCGSR